MRTWDSQELHTHIFGPCCEPSQVGPSCQVAGKGGNLLRTPLLLSATSGIWYLSHYHHGWQGSAAEIRRNSAIVAVLIHTTRTKRKNKEMTTVRRCLQYNLYSQVHGIFSAHYIRTLARTPAQQNS
jgi:hypothetical protein